MRSRTIGVLLLAGTLAACDAGTGDVWSGAVDTLASGAVAVRNGPAGRWGDRPWRLERAVRIGAADGAGPAVFGMVSDVVLGPEGAVYVLDGQAREVRVFDLTGRHLRTIGREGPGPGELQAPYALAFSPDGELWVADERGRRYVVYRPDGTFVTNRRRPIRWPLSRGELHFSRDGALHELGQVDASRFLSIALATDGAEVMPRDTVTSPAAERLLFTRRLGREGIGVPVPYAPWQTWALGPEGELWTGIGDAYRLAQLRGDGDTVRLVTLDAPRAPLADAEVAHATRAADDAAGQGLEVDLARIPAEHPYFTSLVVAGDGHLWVRRTVADLPLQRDGARAAVYDVFTPEGRYLGSVPAPVDEEPAPQIAGGLLVGVRRDSLDVPYVEVYRVVRPEMEG